MIRTLAYKVCRIIARHVETGASDASSRSRNEEYFNQFMGVLARHYMQQRSVGFYAGQLNLTPKYLTTIIRKTSGRTAVQWIDDYVVLEAKKPAEILHDEHPGDLLLPEFPQPVVFREILQEPYGHDPHRLPAGEIARPRDPE